ncbi:MAG: internalization-related competence protein ComEC/Rec2 [Jatrophihabitantaceae bacterium]|nr:internalization-related competence protein ComEC/Rec2 [Jatrophihabitantaceae bacterium]
MTGPAMTGAASSGAAEADSIASDALLPKVRVVDLRLAAATGTGWIAAAAALLLPIWATWLMLGSAVAAGGAALVLPRWRLVRWPRLSRLSPEALRLIVVAAAGVVLVLAPMLPRLHQARESPLADLARAHASVRLEVTLEDDPRVLAGARSGPPRILVRAAVDGGAALGSPVGSDAGGGAPALRGHVLVMAPAEGWLGLLPGQRLSLVGELDAPRGGSLLAAVVYVDDAPARHGLPPVWQRGAGSMRAALREAVSGLGPGPRGLLPGLVVGDTSQMDPVLAQRFNDAGMSHLLAVSGTNCSILIGAIVLVLRRAGVRPRTCAVLAMVVLLGFVVLARPSPSVVRAAVMAAVALIALALGRERTAIPVLAFAALALLIWQPQWALEAGFAMSVGATASLLLIAPGWARRLRERGVPPFVAEAVAISAAASVATLPIIVAIGGPLSIVTVPANMLAEPAVPVATVLGLLVAVIAPVHLGTAHVLAKFAGLPCRWLIAVAERFGGLEGAALPWPSGVMGALALLVAIGIVAAAVHRGLGPALLGALLVAALIQFPVRALTSAWPPSNWDVVACDVGEGDGLVLRAGEGSAVVVDTGSEPLAIDGCLRRLGIVEVPLLVLTHLHADHVGGIAGAFHGRKVGQVVASPLHEPQFGLDLVVKALASDGRPPTDLITPQVGSSARIGDIALEFLWPARALHGTHSDPNNSSLVIRATIGALSILLTGDSEIEEQEAMLEAGVDVRADVLKSPHHGSRFVSAAFLVAVQARVAVISVGQPNDYGHPAPELLADLRQAGIGTVLRTDQSGDVALAAAADGSITAIARGREAVDSALTIPWARPEATAGAQRGRSRIRRIRSAGRDTMSAWTRRRAGRVGASIPPLSCWCRATRSCSSPARSPPALPRHGPSTPMSMSGSSRPAQSPPASCSTPAAPRSSAGGGSRCCARPRSCRSIGSEPSNR